MGNDNICLVPITKGYLYIIHFQYFLFAFKKGGLYRRGFLCLNGRICFFVG